MKATSFRVLAVILLLALFTWLFGSCGKNSSSAPRPSDSSGARQTTGKVSLANALQQIDAYPIPKGVSAQLWGTLTTDLKRQLIARAGGSKIISVAPTGPANAVSDLVAASDTGGTQATITWTEKLAGDYNNDGSVDIADLQPLALFYMQSTDTGADDVHKLVNGDDNPEINIADLGAIAQNYMAHIEGYQVWRGHFDGTTVDWETTPRPNPNAANPNWSTDRPSPPPASMRPFYTYSDDLTSAPDTLNVRYKVVPYGDGAPGQESNEATMPVPGTTFTVSGTVTASGTGLPGVTMALTPSGGSAVTHPDGTYLILAVPNGSYTLTPTKGGYTFSPPNLPVTVAGADVTSQDFTGTALVYSVSGTVSGAGVSGGVVTMTLAPGGQTATAQMDGSYTIASVWEGTYTLTPSMPGYAFTPPSRSVTVSGANVTGQDFVSAPVTYTVSGTVLIGGTGLGGVTMTLSPGGLNALTQANGKYTIYNVPAGGYSLGPARLGYSFTPSMRTVNVSDANVTGQDFTATQLQLGLANSAWPKFRGNAKNTGLSTHVGPQAANVKWTCTTGAAVWGSPAIGADGTIYIGSDDGYVYSLNPADGSVKWKFCVWASTIDGINGSVEKCPAVGADGTIYVGTLPIGTSSSGTKPGSLFALKPSDGSIKWSFTAGGWIGGSPAIGADGTIYIGTDDDWPLPPSGYGSIYALNPGDGTVRWRFASRINAADGSPAIGADGTVYVGVTGINYPNTDPTVYALGPLSGGVKWSRILGDGVVGSPAVGTDGTVYVSAYAQDAGGYDSIVCALNPADGSTKWSKSIVGTGIVDSSPAIGPDGTIYIGTCDAKFMAFSPVDGSVKWAYAPPGGAVGTSAAVGADGTIYFGSDMYGNYKTIYALNPDGSVKWTYDQAGEVRSSPAIGADGTLYVGSFDYKVYAFGP